VAAYAASKLGGELVAGSIARAAGLSFVTLRFAALYGPDMAWSGVLPAFLDAALDGTRLRAASGAHADFLHVDDAAEVVVRAAAGNVEGILNVASGVETPIVALARLALKASGRPEDALDTNPSAVTRAVVDVGRLQRELGFRAQVPLARGVEALLALRRSQRFPS
jgi:dTDP-glucose 4,6-dehydratase